MDHEERSPFEVVSDASKKQKLFQNLESSFLRQIFFFSLDYMHR